MCSIGDKRMEIIMNKPRELSPGELDRIAGGRVATNPPTSIDIWAFFKAFA